MESEAATAERRSTRSSRPRAPKRDARHESGARESRREPKRGSKIENAEDAARRAVESLGRLVDHPAEGSSEVGRGEDRTWRVCVDVVELRRIPDTMSLMATYEVDLAESGDLLGYRRVRRYHRGTADA